MTKLVIKLNNEIVDDVRLEQGIMKIGRKPACEITLDNLAVSGEHAQIYTLGDDSFLQDLNSTNGTFVNKQRITKHHLRHGDNIGIGQYTLIYVQASARADEGARSDYTRTVIIDAGSAEAAVGPAGTAAGGGKGAVLHVLDAKKGRRSIELTKAVTNLGKTGRSAGVITRTDDGYVLRPSGKTDKLKINGRAVGTAGTHLRHGDIIEVAGTRLQFYLK